MSTPMLLAPVAPSRYRQLVIRGLLSLLALVCVLHLTKRTSSPPPSIAKSHPGSTLTFKSYLKAHFPISAPLSDDLGEELAQDARPHLWLTVADAQMMDGPTAGLQMMIRKLNQEREAKMERRTELVVLCLDTGCLSKAEERGSYAYGGFRGGVPIRMVGGPREWFKVAGVLDALRSGRDVFFVDSEVYFKNDPYPLLDPLLNSADIVAGEMPVGTLNTGLMWIKASDKALEMWETMSELAIEGAAKVQDDFNKLLATADRLTTDPEGSSNTGFLSANGLQVQLLDPNSFRGVNIIFGDLEVERPDAVSLQLSCSGDSRDRAFIAQSLGYYPDLDGYYTSRRSLLKIDELRGSSDEVLQMFKILLVAAHYSRRSIEPPSTVTFTDLAGLPRPIYTSFAISRIGKSIGVSIVEYNYAHHAIQHLASAPPLPLGGPRGVEAPQAVLSEGEEGEQGVEDPEFVLEDENEEEEGVAALQGSAELDLRNCETLSDLLHRLLSHAYHHERVLTLTNFRTAPNWRNWELPEPVANLTTCLDLDKPPTCGAICRRSAEEPKKTKWPSLREVMVEPGAW
ncbi:hypothetical protein BCR35DRAFT_353484 [Leucosporidium creatinivorum]|uniref:Nucleotide-diphospho-sugar transferase domain-containing protein n=1 Tax=Leucosporidium creatinivorum TaxID=106004 RepID=A0A1Y2EWI2_9BASI|nr:hypothetical protein BCR35DRAFT_353484 [Leucosporidium creatinivorum]